jgi:hypothetical protein
MSVNVGSADRIIRIVVGLILLALPFISGWSAPGTIVSALIGAVLAVNNSILDRYKSYKKEVSFTN